MPTNWSGRLARIDAAADRHLGERLRFVPLTGGRYAAGVADPGRAVIDEFLARLHIGHGHADLGGEGSRTWQTVIPTGKAMAEVTDGRLPPGTEIRKDDRIEALDRGRVFTVERAHPNEEGVLLIELSEVAP